jgi:nitrate reductase assembly molybdenum cofactor insertion protein NarJ
MTVGFEFQLSSLCVKSFYGWAMGTVQEPRGRGMSAVESQYQRTGVETADREDSVRAVKNCRA